MSNYPGQPSYQPGPDYSTPAQLPDGIGGYTVPLPLAQVQAEQATAMVVNQQPGIVIQQVHTVFGQSPQNIVCLHCSCTVVTALEYTNGAAVWLAAAFLCVVGLWCCCWVPCVVDAIKDVTHKCPNCGHIVGECKRM